MALSAREKSLLRQIIALLERMAFAAADPHVDCRDEMSGWSDAMEDLVDELVEVEVDADADKPIDLFAGEDKGGST